MKQRKSSIFEVNMKVWRKDNRGLFDYSAPADQFKEETFNLRNNCTVYRDNVHGQNYFTAKKQKIFPYFTYVCHLDKDNSSENGTYKLKYSPPSNLQPMNDQNSTDLKDFDLARNTPYIVINNYETKCEETNEVFLGYPLKLRDVIKVGLFQYTVVQMKTKDCFMTLLQQKLQSKTSLGEVCQIRKEEDIDMNETTLKFKNSKENSEQDLQVTQKTIKKKNIKKQRKTIKSKGQKNQKPQRKRSEQNQEDKEPKSEMQSEEDEETIKYSLANKQFKKRDSDQQEQSKSKIKQQKLCRICLSSQEKKIDPFITPCKCKGSCSIIHLQCLQQWVSTRTTLENTNQVLTYKINKPYCQLCKYPLPKVIQAAGQIHYMVPFRKPENPYLILQSSNVEKQFSQERKYIVIPGVQGQNIKIGRHYQAEIKFTDLTVSRNHSEIFYKNNQFYIKDNGSKFGTLLKLDCDLQFNNQTLQIQMGRCLYKFTPLPKRNEQDDSDLSQ